jgi:NAD(P)-dependent dehydrogenase (short-subunit alcohol dehydrogenase family)
MSLPFEFEPSPDHLQDRVVLVTGATGDVGQVLCPALAAHGAQLILAGRNVPRLERLFDQVEAQDGPQPAIYPIDLAGATADHYDQLVETVASEMGGLDAVVHLAAEFEGLSPLAQTPADKWMAAVQVNLNAPFMLNSALQSLLLASGHGRIIMTLDDPLATRQAYWGAYGVTKAGVEAMTAIAAEELESSTLEVNAVCPPPMTGRHRGKFSMASEAEQLTEPDALVPAYLYLLGSRRGALNGVVITQG